MFSLTDTGWFSMGTDGLSFPGGATVLGSVLDGWMGGWGTGPTGCWGALVVVVVELGCAGEPVPLTALLLLDAEALDAGVTPVGLGSGGKSCFLAEDGVGTLGWGLYGVGLGVWGEAAAADVFGAHVVEMLVVVTGVPELAALLCSWVELGLAWAPVLGVPPLCLGEPFALPGLTGRTGKGPQVLAAGEKVPPNCAMGRRGCLIWCMVWAASKASWGWAYARGSDTGKGCLTLDDSPFPILAPVWEEDDDADDEGWNETPLEVTNELRAFEPAAEPLADAVLAKEADAALEPGALMWFRGIRSSSSLAGSWIRALINWTAYLVDSVPPLKQNSMI